LKAPFSKLKVAGNQYEKYNTINRNSKNIEKIVVISIKNKLINVAILLKESDISKLVDAAPVSIIEGVTAIIEKARKAIFVIISINTIFFVFAKYDFTHFL
jgi:hypothetical protein